MELRNGKVIRDSISPVKVQNATQKEKEDTVQNLESENESEEESPGHIDEEHLKTSRSKDGGHHVPQGEYDLDNNAKERRLKTETVEPTQLAEHQREQEEHIDRGQEQQQQPRTTSAPTTPTTTMTTTTPTAMRETTPTMATTTPTVMEETTPTPTMAAATPTTLMTTPTTMRETTPTMATTTTTPTVMEETTPTMAAATRTPTEIAAPTMAAATTTTAIAATATPTVETPTTPTVETPTTAMAATPTAMAAATRTPTAIAAPTTPTVETPTTPTTRTTRRTTTRSATTTMKGTKAKEAKEKKKQRTEPAVRGNNRIALHNIFLVGLIVCCFVIFVVIISASGRSDEHAPSSKIPNDDNDSRDYEKIFNNSLTEMKSGFPNQTSRFWLILTNRGLAHLRNRNPKQPLVIMLGAPPSAYTIVDCLAMRLARSLDPERKLPNVFNGSDYSQSDGHVTKKLLDTKLDELFRKGVRSVLVLRLDRLPHPSPVLFYRYCDSETAPYKHPAIIFTVNLREEPSTSLRPVEAEGLVEKYLAEVVWHKEDDDGIAELLSRVTDTVALVSGEGEDVLRTECKRN